ncbi:hybrid histidine kinase/response regulator HrmK [Sphaerospermopsis torques-reginae]|uniref:histidine kinase n=1 Tax=Sphaerospermopsis torques-reginae ITEP-024 TaxID=984208 RepID=A0ABX8WZ21_9CYAN|nr:hybrid histidine kinase/response regulator HrmK [Sphaerospermopsis torques-reginae]QYX31426.1 hybrid histidine kinase/response regulator HrmK [Sphaerospermopsis torques-reginae ITEP-024]
MQQSPSLPEQNSQIDGTPKLLHRIQQLRDNFWLQNSLNHLQNRLNDCLLAANMMQSADTKAEIYQTVVNELEKALNARWVAIAQFQPDDIVGKICYVSSYPSLRKQTSEIISQPGTKLDLRLNATIRLEDLQQMEKQKPGSAWRLFEDANGMMAWLIIDTSKSNVNGVSIKPSLTPLRSQFIKRTIQYCHTALTQLKQIQFWQERCQQLANYNQELERTNQLKNQFLANTSHEIRTPLSCIVGFTHLLLAQGYEPERQRHQEYLHIIQSSGKYLLNLINDILDLSKIEANQLEVQWEIIDVPLLCGNVLALVKEKAANKGLKLRLQINDDVTTLLADPLRLKQMLLNLLFNAIKFTNSGSVGLRVATQDLYLRFTVWDTGIGIYKEDQSLLFRPYSQIINSGSRNNEGTGLGLVVTQQLAQIHGGYLELESEVNKGSAFTIILPLQPTGKVLDAIEDKAEKDLELSKVTSNSSVHIPISISREILLVEDDFANSELMRIYLSRLSYQLTCVKNTQEMWMTLPQIQPAVILMDVNLPDSNGLNVVEQLRKHPQYQHIPIIAQTAMAMKGDRETCLAAGFDDYISKPIDLQILGSMVAKYCQGFNNGQLIIDH